MSTLPWIDDHFKWGEFNDEREEIASWIKELGLQDKMIIVSGDAHMLAVDDGSHAAGGVKVFHAAAIDAKPTTKGGPYSHGVWPGRNQYGTIEVRDLGDHICFRFQGWKWKSSHKLARLVQFDTCDTSLNTPLLYKPSPYVVQKFWKVLKGYLESSKLDYARHFVLWVDSSKMTFYSLFEIDNMVSLTMICVLAGFLVRLFK